MEADKSAGEARILELWRKIGVSNLTGAETKEWMAYLDRSDTTSVETGQLWRNKISRDLVRVVATTNQYDQVTVSYLSGSVSQEQISGSSFERLFEFKGKSR